MLGGAAPELEMCTGETLETCKGCMGNVAGGAWLSATGWNAPMASDEWCPSFVFRAGAVLFRALRRGRAEKVGPKPYQAGWRDAALIRNVKLQCDYLLGCHRLKIYSSSM